MKPIILSLILATAIFFSSCNTSEIDNETSSESTDTSANDIVDQEIEGGLIISETEVIINEGTEYELKGILSIPLGAAKPYPAVVLVHDSGSYDRDETIYNNKIFRNISKNLTEKGIAVLRYDKRSYSYKEKMVELISSVSAKEDIIDDAISASNFLKADSRIDKNNVFVIGHGFGGSIAPRIDAEGGDFAGIVIMSGSPKPLKELLIEQVQASLYEYPEDEQEEVKKNIDALLAEFENIKTMTDEEAGEIILLDMSGYYYNEMDKYPNDEYTKNSEKPMFIIHGGKNIQISEEDSYTLYQNLLEGKENVSFKLYPDLNYLFMEIATGDMNDYKREGRVSGEVLNDISDWIKDNLK